MPRKVTHEELALMIEELDRGEAHDEELEQLVESVELAVSDIEAVNLLRDHDLTAEEVAEELMGYSEKDI